MTAANVDEPSVSEELKSLMIQEQIDLELEGAMVKEWDFSVRQGNKNCGEKL